MQDLSSQPETERQGSETGDKIIHLRGSAKANEEAKGKADGEAAPPPASGIALYDLSHDGLALHMGKKWPDARHVALWGRWLFWTGSYWQVDEKLQHFTRTREYLRRRGDALVRWAQQLGDPKKIEECVATAKQLRSSLMVINISSLARSNPDQAAVTGQWDADPFRLTSLEPPITICLRTGEQYVPRQTDYVTKTVAIAPAERGTDAPLWFEFLDKITDRNAELQRYLQRVAGYCLTGSVEEHALFFLYGTGANGKSVFVATLIGVLHDYAVTVGTDMLMVSTTDRHPTEIARLRGARLAVGNEVEVNRTWAESKIKALTGGDRLQGRFMRQDFFEFDPQFKLMVVGNNKPSLRGVDEAIRRRMHLIPFTVTIPEEERDLELTEKLKAEWPAILRWALEGCLNWKLEGLAAPETVRTATDSYLAAEDTFEQWKQDCTKGDSDAWESSSDLWGSWRKWAEGSGETVGSKKQFSAKLEDHGLKPQRQGGTGTRGYVGLDLNRPDYTDDKRYGG